MTDDASQPGRAAVHPASGTAPAPTPVAAGSAQARFEFLTVGEREPATVRCVGDIDLTNVGQFQATLDEAAATASAITVDLTEVSYCDSAAIRALFNAARQTSLTIAVSATGPINGTLLKVSGLDQVATVVSLD